MDLESEFSVLESVDDNEATKAEKLANVEETNIENNGPCAVQHFDDDKLLPDGKEKGTHVISSPTVTKLESLPSSVTSKGYGLKKWRRIKREVNKDGSRNLDDSKLLKRGLSNSGTNLNKPMQFYVGRNQKSGISVSSTNATVRSPGVMAHGFVMLGDSGLLAGPTFVAGTDSENSEDRSSKSSTAVSAPKVKSQTPATVGHANDKNRIRSLNAKNLGNFVQKGQQGKGLTETFKKPRGERVRIEKENSQSSMESDSRSSNYVFMQDTNSATSNRRQRGMTLNNNEENSDEAQGGERQFTDELPTGCGRKDAGEFEDVSQENLPAVFSWKVKGDRHENRASSIDQNPLAESILALQSAQEALEQELQKLRDIGKEDSLVSEDGSLPSDFTPVNPKVHKASSSDHLQFGVCGQSSSHSLEIQVSSLRQNVKLLESRLEEARAVLKMKEAKVTELEATLDGRNSTRGEEETAILLQKEKCKDMVGALESLFRQKIEAEVEYLAISRTIHRLRVAEVDQITLLKEQEILPSEQAQVVGMDEALGLQNSVCRYTLCFFIQLILLVVVIGLFILQLSPYYTEVVPT